MALWVAADDDDASGTVLAAVRKEVGQNIPIVASLDLHANVTSKMQAASDGLIGYKTCPHIDLYGDRRRQYEPPLEYHAR